MWQPKSFHNYASFLEPVLFRCFAHKRHTLLWRCYAVDVAGKGGGRNYEPPWKMVDQYEACNIFPFLVM
jgi:hypothetical protein